MLLRDLQDRGLVKMTQCDDECIRWHLTLYGIEYVERAAIVAQETAQYHRSASMALIRKFLAEHDFAILQPKDGRFNDDDYSPEMLAANVIFLYEGRR